MFVDRNACTHELQREEPVLIGIRDSRDKMLVKVKNEALLVELDGKVLVAACEVNWSDGHRSHTDAVCKTGEQKETQLKDRLQVILKF